MKKFIDFIINHPGLLTLIGAIIGAIIAAEMENGNWIVGMFSGGMITFIAPFIILVGGADFGRFRKK